MSDGVFHVLGFFRGFCVVLDGLGFGFCVSLIISKVKQWLVTLCRSYNPKQRSSLGFGPIVSKLGINVINPPPKPPIIIFWARPPVGFVALNSDGAAKCGLAAGGGIIRDVEGNHLSNYFSFYGKGTNNLVETRAILDGVALCAMLGYNRVYLQTDSKMALQWLNQTIPIPWHLRLWWRHYRNVTKNMTIMAIHVYREGNTPADHLSKQGLLHKCMGGINNQVDKTLKLALLSDKENIPYIRHKR
ncbi:hypothetical protein FRX31_028016 [Thalictrum thalictroides]|uniref:RNase H type-1 domain-containing protein n=1 Tax=Thalictrum thalictroides TaxID=46969 RepID=A0A7J6VBE1_THATH|nr:hypothetical protein FRX31_028016 [Thalictrum thalictroides]